MCLIFSSFIVGDCASFTGTCSSIGSVETGRPCPGCPAKSTALVGHSRLRRWEGASIPRLSKKAFEGVVRKDVRFAQGVVTLFRVKGIGPDKVNGFRVAGQRGLNAQHRSYAHSVFRCFLASWAPAGSARDAQLNIQCFAAPQLPKLSSCYAQASQKPHDKSPAPVGRKSLTPYEVQQSKA